MGNPKIKSEGGQGGKKGHSGMEHWMYTEEIKEAAKKVRRKESKEIIRKELNRTEENDEENTEPTD